ncbi:MAG: hypothetical protein QOE98_2234 [Gaiellaceae bacterium]|nr:hypothetical protein [Gaiellaceae bacterium]
MNVQDLVLLEPLEHAPDQMADRPSLAVSVILVPVANEADPLLPTATLIPAGLDVIRVPLRPVAVTVSVAAWEGGLTVSVAVRVTAPAVAVIVTGVDVATAVVAIAKLALVAPCATETLAGSVATAVLLLDSVTANPPAGAADVSVIVPCDAAPPVTLAGVTDTAESAAAGAVVCGVKRRTDDHAPSVPAELTPRTRHQCCRAASVETVSCDAVTACSRTSGLEKLLESSTCTR